MGFRWAAPGPEVSGTQEEEASQNQGRIENGGSNIGIVDNRLAEVQSEVRKNNKNLKIISSKPDKTDRAPRNLVALLGGSPMLRASKVRTRPWRDLRRYGQSGFRMS